MSVIDICLRPLVTAMILPVALVRLASSLVCPDVVPSIVLSPCKHSIVEAMTPNSLRKTQKQGETSKDSCKLLRVIVILNKIQLKNAFIIKQNT